jgi:hypothetical protein
MRVRGGLKIAEVDTAQPKLRPEPGVSWLANGHDDNVLTTDKKRPASGVLMGMLIGLCLWLLIGIVACVLLAVSGY